MQGLLINTTPQEIINIMCGKQNLILRKMKPVHELPMVGYLYCSKNGINIEKDCGLGFPESLNGRVIAKFMIDKIEKVVSCLIKEWGEDPWERRMSLRLEETDDDGFDEHLIFDSGYDGEYKKLHDALKFPFPSDKGAPVPKAFKEGVVYGYAIHISDLEIFDKPKELGDFMFADWNKGLEAALEKARKEDEKFAKRIFNGDADETEVANCEELTMLGYVMSGMVRQAPISWLYVEELECEPPSLYDL